MPIVIVIFVAVFIVAAIVIGRVVGSQSPPAPVGSEIKPAGNCADACAAWRIRVGETCLAVEQVRLKQATADATGRQLAAAVATHLALVAAAVAAAFIPFIGPYLAVALGAAAAVAGAFAAGLFGIWTGENAAVEAARREESDARGRQDAARVAVITHCPAEEATACFNATSTC